MPGKLAPGPESYKEKAAEALRQAQAVKSKEARTELLLLAEHWQRLAQATERPDS